MQLYQDTIQDRNGNVISSAVVTITDYPGGSASNVYATDAVGTNINPITADSDGQYEFYAVPGAYTLTVTKSGVTTESKVVTLGAAATSFLQSGTGAVSRTVQAKERDIVSVKDFGAVGDGTTDDTASVQACVTAAVAAGKAVYFPSGTYKITSTITATGWWSYYGDGPSSIVTTALDIALFTFSINSTVVDGWEIRGLFFVGPTSTNASSCALRFIGDSTAFIQYGYCNVTSIRFNAFLKDEKTALAGGGMLNWNTWEVRLLNGGSYGFWYTQGSGTGNRYNGQIVTLNAGSAAFFFDGSGCEVGDFSIAVQFGCQAAGGIGVKVGASTIYRAQWVFTGSQFDANCDIPLSLSATGAITYKNINLCGVNWGGNSALGTSVQPMYSSVVTDRASSDWMAGVTKTSNTIGAISIDCFSVDFAAWGAGVFDVFPSGLIGGVNSCASNYQFQIREASGSLTVVTNTSTLGVANGFVAAVTTSGTTATIKITCTSSAVGTLLWATVRCCGGSGFKITRL